MYTTILALTLSVSVHAPGQFEPPGTSNYSPTPPAAPILQRPVPATRPIDPVLGWNEVTLRAIKADRTPPPLAARNLAIVHAAIYDAVNAIDGRHFYFYVNARAPVGASLEAATAAAAHRALIALYPKQLERLNEALDDSLASVPEGQSREDGFQLGRKVAEGILAWRNRDGMRQRVNYRPHVGPGVWRPTLPGYQPPLLPQWPSVTCFCMRSGPQFRPAGPPALTSERYAADFNEVKALGRATGSTRTREQTEIALFWKDCDGTVTPPGHWNRIAQDVSRARRIRLADNARLFLLVNLAMADAGISCWDCKYHYNFWRPVTAIRQTDPRANPALTPDPNWTPLIETPPFPSYTSGHSSFSSAAAAMLADFFGSDNIPFKNTSEYLPGVTRSFPGFWAAAEEAGMSRIYGGIHYRFDNVDGLVSGRAVADYIYRNFLRPRELAREK